MKAFYFCLVNVAQVSWARLVDFCVFLFSAAFIVGKRGEGESSDYTEILNLERLERVRICIWRLSSFSDSRHLKGLVCDQAYQVERTVLGVSETPLPFTPTEYHKWQICALCDTKRQPFSLCHLKYMLQR